jgi:hypothetical protein
MWSGRFPTASLRWLNGRDKVRNGNFTDCGKIAAKRGRASQACREKARPSPLTPYKDFFI